jgi:DNA-directed RNA polymerase subunit RPC12/RpoP
MTEDFRKMTVISEPEPNTRSVFEPTFKGPARKGSGPLSYKCGKCGATLLRHAEYKQVMNMVVKCGGCGSFNEIPVAHHAN